MDTWTVVKIISSILIWTTLLVDYSRCSDKDNNIPKNVHELKNPSATTTTTPSTAPKATTHSGQNTAERKKSENNSTNEVLLNSTSQITVSGNAEHVANSNNTLGKAEPYRQQPINVMMHTEETRTSKSVWMYITIGILCVAAFNIYIFWYRKRTSTYSFTPTGATTTKTRR